MERAAVKAETFDRLILGVAILLSVVLFVTVLVFGEFGGR
jgi:hypothetical protein